MLADGLAAQVALSYQAYIDIMLSRPDEISSVSEFSRERERESV